MRITQVIAFVAIAISGVVSSPSPYIDPRPYWEGWCETVITTCWCSCRDEIFWYYCGDYLPIFLPKREGLAIPGANSTSTSSSTSSYASTFSSTVSTVSTVSTISSQASTSHSSYITPQTAVTPRTPTASAII